jgi:hypothetical protein
MITSIKREFDLFPNIVGIVTTDNLATISSANYFSSQLAQVELLNNGVWQWETQDIVLIYYATNQVGFFQYNKSTDSFTATSGTQTQSVSLTAAQILGMYAVPVPLLPALSLGMMYVVDNILWDVTYGTTQYAAGGAIAAQYGSTIQGGGTAAAASIAAATLNAVAANTVFNEGSASTLNAARSAVSGLGIYLSNATAAFTTGNSTVVLTIRFHIVAV